MIFLIVLKTPIFKSYLLCLQVHSRVQSYLVYVYTALARLSGQIMRVRTLVYDVIYCYNVRFAVFVLPILETWEDVLPVKHIEEYYGLLSLIY